MSTSGGYERFFLINEKRFSHIINPKTGFPVQRIMSATVISKDSVTADALSTGLSVMPPEKGLQLINQLSGVEAILILGKDDKISKILLSKGLKNKVHIHQKEVFSL